MNTVNAYIVTYTYYYCLVISGKKLSNFFVSINNCAALSVLTKSWVMSNFLWKLLLLFRLTEKYFFSQYIKIKVCKTIIQFFTECE